MRRDIWSTPWTVRRAQLLGRRREQGGCEHCVVSACVRELGRARPAMDSSEGLSKDRTGVDAGLAGGGSGPTRNGDNVSQNWEGCGSEERSESVLPEALDAHNNCTSVKDGPWSP